MTHNGLPGWLLNVLLTIKNLLQLNYFNRYESDLALQDLCLALEGTVLGGICADVKVGCLSQIHQTMVQLFCLRGRGCIQVF